MLTSKSLSAIVSTVLMTFTLMGCNTTTAPSDSNADKTGLKETPAHLHQTQCGPFNPEERVMCTMHFEPVCVTEKQADGSLSYRTAGNSCSACSTAESISYTDGECPLS